MSKITNFLTKSKKSFVAEKVAQQSVRELEPKDDSGNEQNEYKEKLYIAEKNLRIAKNLLRQSNDLNVQKDLKIKRLVEQSGDSDVKSNDLYDEYSTKFNADELKAIRSTGPGISNDSTFILNIMRSLYKDEEMKKLDNRSATGRKYKGEAKAEISFEKKELMKNMLTHRITGELKNHFGAVDEISKRIGRLNELVRSAIHNIRSNRRKRHRSESEVDDSPQSKTYVQPRQTQPESISHAPSHSAQYMWPNYNGLRYQNTFHQQTQPAMPTTLDGRYYQSPYSYGPGRFPYSYQDRNQ